MSLYKDASLVMIPSAYKDGKLYSIRPTDGSGDFTFSRGSNLAATRVDVNGLIEKGRENLVPRSNAFSTTWFNQNTTESSGQIGYDGTNDGWLLTKSQPSAYIAQQYTFNGSVYTFSLYAKANDLTHIQLWSGTFWQFFDLSAGTKGTASSNLIESSITSVGSGWYRVSVTGQYNGLSTLRIYPAQADGDTSGSSGSIYIQDAQLEAGLVATDYIETGVSTAQAGILEDMPRLDYSGSCPALLLEPQRTNLVSQSEFYGGSDWSRTRCGIVTNTSETLSPEGLYNASKMISTAIQESYAQDNVTLSSTSGTYTFFAKKGDLDYCHALVWDIGASGRRQWFNLATGAVGTTTNFGSGYTKVDATIEDYGNGWYRCSFSWSGGNTTSGVRINISSGDGVIDSPINSYGYFYGAQVEAGVSYPTSYIPTYGSSVTRSADSDGSGVDVSSLVSTNYTCFYEIDPSQFSGGTTWIGQQTSGGACWQVYGGTMIVRTSSGVSYPFGHAAGTRTKVAVVYDGETIYLYKDGAFNSSALADNTRWGNFTNIELSFDNNNLIRYNQVAVFPTALTSSEAIALTTL